MASDSDDDADEPDNASNFLRFLDCKYLQIIYDILMIFLATAHTFFLLAFHQPIYINLPSIDPSIHSIHATATHILPASSIPPKQIKNRSKLFPIESRLPKKLPKAVWQSAVEAKIDQYRYFFQKIVKQNNASGSHLVLQSICFSQAM